MVRNSEIPSAQSIGSIGHKRHFPTIALGKNLQKKPLESG